MTSLALEADGLALGESKLLYCHYCDNCKPYAPSLSVTRVDDGAVFNCFRSSCGAKGYVPVNGVPILSKDKRDSIKHQYNYKLSSCELLSTNLSTTVMKHQRVLYNRELGTVAYTCYNRLGKVFGYVDRSYYGRLPKTINYLDDGVARIHFPKQDWAERAPVWIVEDIASAIRMSKYVNCVSILGTHLDVTQIEVLKETTDSIVLVLDPDATDKAIKHKQQLQNYFKQVRVLMFPKDPKDLTEVELQRELEGEY